MTLMNNLENAFSGCVDVLIVTEKETGKSQGYVYSGIGCVSVLFP